jgi:putative transposase
MVGVRAACEAFDFPRSSFYRKGVSGVVSPAAAGARFVPRALDSAEREAVLASLHEARFQNSAPAAVYATLLDEGRYHCSIRTMYRILESEGEVRERRDQLVHPAYSKPELLATGPNQLWSWDITKLLGPAKWTYFYLYVILDVFSRYVVGWMVADGESSELAKRLIADTCGKQEIEPGKLTIHADRGSSMTSKPVAFLMADLGITKTHSRPHVSDDNPYSESPLQDSEISTRFPGTLWVSPGCPFLLPGVLRLV